MFMAAIFLFTACVKPNGSLGDTVKDEIENDTKYGLDGIIVCVNKPGGIELEAAGWHNRENKVPADPECLFKIASISKLYIAAATAKLVASGQLSLDATLMDYLPEKAARIEYSNEITLRMLVQHRSGIPDYVFHPDYPWDQPFKTAEETYSLVYDMPADFKPDKRYSYSNTNYLLIGDILDTVLGYSHHEYIKTQILEPLALNRTYNTMAEVENKSEIMSGYFVGYEPDIKGNDFVQPGGSMLASASDVSVFLRALIDGSLLNKTEQDIYSSIYKYEHTGLLPGYSSIARYDKDLDAVVVLFINTSGEGNWLSRGGKTWQQMERVYSRVMRILKKSC